MNMKSLWTNSPHAVIFDISRTNSLEYDQTVNQIIINIITHFKSPNELKLMEFNEAEIVKTLKES